MKRLTLKNEKNEFVLIDIVDKSPVLKLGHKHIRHVHYKKSLGMVLAGQLKWDTHSEVQCKKIITI